MKSQTIFGSFEVQCGGGIPPWLDAYFSWRESMGCRLEDPIYDVWDCSGGFHGALGGPREGRERSEQKPQTQGSKVTCSVGSTSTSFSQYLSGVESAASMFGQFLTGTGPSNLTFGPESVQSQMMAASPGITQAINGYNSGQTTGLYTFGLSGLWAAGANPIQQFVGSYTYSVSPTTGGLNITLSNYTSVWSGSYHLLPSHQRSTFGPTGTTHKTYQVFVPCHN